MFYELLSGLTPWDAPTEKELAKLISTVPIKVEILGKNVSEMSKKFIKKCCTVDRG